MEQQISCLKLSYREKAVLHARYTGLSRIEIALHLHTTMHSLNSCISRCARREHCSDEVQLMVRYLTEYMGVGEPYGGDPWEKYLRQCNLKAAR
jgi:DNA-binding NarL/FixJ family response regulator